MNNVTILPILQRIPLLAELNEEDHSEIIKHITLQYYPGSTVLFNEGDEGDRLYIIKMGLVKIFHPVDPDQSVALLGPNDFFGEMALVQEAPRSASAMTVQDSEIFLLEKQDFYDLILKNPSMSEKLSQEFLNRVQENQKNQN